MSSGHTQRDTINRRKPMTCETAGLLAYVIRKGVARWSDLDTADRNRMRALMDRGYVTSPDGREEWSATDAGKKALTVTNS